MEAKDTVMKPKELEKLFDLAYYTNQAYSAGMMEEPCEPEDLMKRVSEAQAEISFKAGIREVVEWLKHIVYEESHLKNFPTMKAYYISDEALQAKLKEWGIK